MALKEGRWAITGRDKTTAEQVLIESKPGTAAEGEARAAELAAKAIGETFTVWRAVASKTVKLVSEGYRQRIPGEAGSVMEEAFETDETPAGPEQGQQDAGQNEGGQA